MKGFIEVHYKNDGGKGLFNLRHIIDVYDNRLVLREYNQSVELMESYEEIKKLIEEAL